MASSSISNTAFCKKRARNASDNDDLSRVAEQLCNLSLDFRAMNSDTGKERPVHSNKRKRGDDADVDDLDQLAKRVRSIRLDSPQAPQVPTAPPTPPASQRALGITEMLETIMMALDNKTLLLAQRVCTTWQATVSHSVKLKQKLYFELAPEKDLEYRIRRPNDGINPLLSRALSDGAHAKNPGFRQVGELPPLWHPTASYRSATRQFHYTVITDSFEEITSPGPDGVVESWRRMYLTKKGYSVRLSHPLLLCDAVEAPRMEDIARECQRLNREGQGKWFVI